MLNAFFAAAAGYLMGSVNSAVIISKLFYKDDVRTHGSGNAGTTNMLRTYGVKAAIATFLGDVLKGFLAVLLAKCLIAWTGSSFSAVYAAYIAGYGAVLGHMFPLYFHFKGGKGVATALGAVFAIAPTIFGLLFPVGLVIAGVSGFVSLASLTGATMFPFVVWFYLYRTGRFDAVELLFAFGMAALIIYNHRENIKRLLSGTENKFYKKKK